MSLDVALELEPGSGVEPLQAVRSCGACMSDDYKLVRYTLDSGASPAWKDSIYCSECIGEIRRTRWLMLKESITKVDCLAAFRNIRASGMPMVLVERDIGAPTNAPVVAISDISLTTALDCDLTVDQRNSLVADLQALSIDTVTDLDIKTVCAKYWPELDLERTQAERQGRPTFMVGSRPYVSAGVLLYTEDSKGQYHFLIQRTQRGSWRYEDFGGKSEVGDRSIEDVAIRECLQETNGICTPSILQRCMADELSIVYPIPECKYMLYVVYLPSSLAPNPKEYQLRGTPMTYEVHDLVRRDLVWLSYRALAEMPDCDIHPRIIGFKREMPLLLAKLLCK